MGDDGIKSTNPARKRPIGRPPKINREIIDRIATSVRAGNYLEVAAAYAGINKGTLSEWLRKGARDREEKRRTLHGELSDAVSKALAEAEVRDVTVIAKAAKEGDWRAAAWRLERKNHRRWGKKDETTVKGDPAAPIQHQHGLQITVVPANPVDPRTGKLLPDKKEE